MVFFVQGTATIVCASVSYPQYDKNGSGSRLDASVLTNATTITTTRARPSCVRRKSPATGPSVER